MRRQIGEVVHLNQVNRVFAYELEGPGELRASLFCIRATTPTWRDIDFRRPEDLVGRASIAGDLTGYFFRGSVGGGGVENRSTVIEQGLHDIRQSRYIVALRDLSERC